MNGNFLVDPTFWQGVAGRGQELLTPMKNQLAQLNQGLYYNMPKTVQNQLTAMGNVPPPAISRQQAMTQLINNLPIGAGTTIPRPPANFAGIFAKDFADDALTAAMKLMKTAAPEQKHLAQTQMKLSNLAQQKSHLAKTAAQHEEAALAHEAAMIESTSPQLKQLHEQAARYHWELSK